VLPYLRFAAADAPLADLLCGLVRRQARSVLLDAYANAFNYNHSGNGHQGDERQPPMSPGVYEGKYELDSLAAFLKLSRHYFNATKDADCLLNMPDPNDVAAGAAAAMENSAVGASRGAAGGALVNSNNINNDDGAPAPSPPLGSGVWLDAVARTLDVLEQQTLGTAALTESGWWYAFQRTTETASDTLAMGGRGPVAAGGSGLSQSWFRPSDDAQALPFLVPANAMALVELVQVMRPHITHMHPFDLVYPVNTVQHV
jgi:hypothetical protein